MKHIMFSSKEEEERFRRLNIAPIEALVEESKEESGNDIWGAIAFLHTRINRLFEHLDPTEKKFDTPELKALWHGISCPECCEVSCDSDCKNFKLRRNNG